MSIKIGIAGIGAIGSALARALTSEEGIGQYKLDCISDPDAKSNFNVPNVDFDTLMTRCDLTVECLPTAVVPELATAAFKSNTDIIFISAAALLLYPQIMDNHKTSESRIYIPSGALCGLDGVRAMRELGIKSAKIASTKPPLGFNGAPFIIENNISLSDIKDKTLLFEGNALEASKGFPANVNVAATLSLAGIGAKNTRVEIWADPMAKSNMHEITISSKYSTLTSRIENMPDPMNPKSSILAAQSIVSTLRNMNNSIIMT
ncbi:MAG: aspartate dehydrogenase [Zetaproteobacteria bacterium]|nr:MAG: aspartate dehydrogenase [Zetaproteobacteria bacterium]